MHITVPQPELDQAATIVSSLVSKGAASSPHSGSLLIDAGEQGVQLRGTDFESMVQVNIQATVKRPGRLIVPAETFRDIIKLLPPKSEVVFEQEGNKAHLHTDESEYHLLTASADDFPEWQTEEAQTRFQIAQRTFKSMLEATVYALPLKDHRKILLGLHFELFDNTLQLTATDGKKLGRVKTSIPEVEGKQDFALTLPRKLVDNLQRSLGSEGPVELEFNHRQVSARFANVLYRGNLMDGKYPDCNAVIPKDFPTQIVLNRETFLQAARRAGIVTDEKSRSVILTFTNNRCLFRSMAKSLGDFSGEVKLDYTGEDMEMAFNFQFLAETLSAFNQPNVILHIKSTAAPVVFKTKEEEDRMALLMPIKLAEARASAMAGAEEEE